MKTIIRICSLFLALLLLTGCGNSIVGRFASLPDSYMEITFPADIDDPVIPTSDNQTIFIPTPTAPAPTEATVPEEITIPTEPVVTEPPETEPPVTEPPVDDPSAAGFDAVYQDIRRLLDTGDSVEEYDYVTVGMLEVVCPLSTKEARFESLSYVLEDTNKDRRPEMIVLDAANNARILAIYTIRDGQPVMIHDGWYRSRLYMLSNGYLYSEGSSGAAYSIFGVNGQLWFTYPKDDAQMNVGFYYAADGSYDPATAQEITQEDYYAKQEEFSRLIISFSAYSFE